jgi:pyrroloquinoline quinone biosynthesis protein B
VWLRVLESAAGGGFPQWNCGCLGCRAVREGSRSCRSRTQSSVEQISSLPIERKIYVHINNTNPILLEDAPERHIVEERGVEVAMDGLEVR